MRTEMKDRLRRSRDWVGTIDEIEREADSLDNKEERSELLFELGNLSEEIVPERDRALAIYQKAWKLHRANLKALTRAREVYQEIGRMEMVAKVGELELKIAGGGPDVADLAALVGESFLDDGQRERALPLLEMAAEAQPDSSSLKDALAAAQYDAEFWADSVERLSDEASKADADTATRMLLRAARILHCETVEDERFENALKQVLENDPQNRSANFLFEMLLSSQERWDDLQNHHERRGLAAEDQERVELYRRFALVWVQRFRDRDRGALFFSKAVVAASQAGGNGDSTLRSTVAAFALIRESLGAKEDWEQFLSLADKILPTVTGDQRLYVASQAGLVAWKELSDSERAQGYFEMVMELEPESLDLADFLADSGDAAPAAEAPAEEAPAEDAPAEEAPAEEAPVEEAPAEEAPAEEAPAAEASAEEAPAEEAKEETPPPEAPSEPAAIAAAPADEEVSDDLESAMAAATAAEANGPDKAIEAWRKAVAKGPDKQAPRRGLARVLREAERWNALVEALKEEEAKAAQSGESKVAVLREMVDVYRDHLKLDVMVVNTLGQILTHEPDNIAVLDQLATQYESMKRWPDLVATLQKKAPHLADESERIALHLRIANLYIDKFSNQAEAIKAFEKVLELDRENAEATAHLMAVYEKRRDWAKLINLREAEIDRTEDSTERALKTYEVAKLAATRLKKPDICMHWWAKVLDDDPGHEEAITELEKLYERGKRWEDLSATLEKKVLIATDDKTQTDALQKLGLLYSDKIDEPEKAVESWKRLLSIDPSHRRAQDALKKGYIASGNWEELEEFYRGQDKLAEFVRVLERQVDSADTDEEDKLRLALRIAIMYRDEISKADRAMRAFEKVLTLDEANLEAAEALIPLYEGGRDPRKLTRVLEIQLDQTSDPATRQDRIKRLAEYSEERLRDKGAAFGWWLKAHTEDHEAEWIREQVERLAQETGSYSELVDAYESSYAKFSDPAASLPLMSVVGKLLEEELADVDRALATNQKILELDEHNEAALNALERLFVSRERYDELLDVYQKKYELTLDGDARTAIQFKIGQLYEEEVKDDDKAIATYKQILDDSGESSAALQALDRIYLRNEGWADLADILLREISLVEPEGETLGQHVELKFRLGQLREQHLDDVTSAIDSYREVLDLSSNHPGAREALEARLSDDEHKLGAAAILEPIYESLEEWPRLIEVHEIEIAASDNQFRRVQLLMRVGELYSQKLGDAEKAFAAYARAFKEDPSTEGAKTQLEELCNLLDDGWPKLVELFEGAVARDDLDPSLSHELAMKVARAYEIRLDNTDKAVEYFRRSLTVEPDDLDAINALEAIFTRDEKYTDLLEVYRRKVDITTDPDERLAILFRIAGIHEEMLQNSEDAIATYNEVLSHDGENLNALRALDRLYVNNQRWQDLGDNLSRQLILCEDDNERVLLLVRLAQLRESQLEETAAAVETYRQVLDIQPTNEDSVTALQRLISNEEHELTIAQILEPIYQSTGDWERQIGIYEIMARHAYDPERKIELRHKIAELYEMGGDRGQDAFETYARAMKEEPRSETTRSQLERLARMLERWRDVVGLYADVASEVSDEELKVALLTRKAQIHELELHEDAAAVQTYESILEGAPSHVDAATAILAIHERNADYPALVAVLKKKSELILDLPERKELLHKAAQIQEEVLEDAEAAISTYNGILDIDDIDGRALDALDRLYVALSRWEPLKDVYAKKADLAETPEEKMRLLHVLGSVYETELGDVAKAIETYQGILDLNPDERDAIQALDRLFGRAERWYDLLSNLERQIEVAETTGEAVALKYRVGQLWQTRLTDVSRSIESYREALELDSTHVETLQALDGLLRLEDGDGGEAVMAARVLEPIYESSFEFDRLAFVLEVMVKHAEDPTEKVGLLHRIAEIREARLEQYPEAFDAYCRALREENGDELTLGHLERLAEATNGWATLAELYSGEAEKSLDVPRQVDLLTRLARVYEEELSQVEEAIGIYGKIGEADYDNRTSVLALDRLYTQTGNWEQLVSVLRKEIQLADGDEEITALQFRLGQVLQESVRDLPAAIEVYREILTTNPEHGATIGSLEMLFLEGHHEVEIAGVLEPLYQSAGEFEKLHKIYEVQLTKLTELDERQSMFQRLAELAEQQLYDQSRAVVWWGEALVEEPRSDLAHEELERLARDTGAWNEAVAVYVRILERHTGEEAAEVQKQTLLRLARIYDSELGEAVSAVETYLRVLEIDEKDPDALAALDRLYAQAGMYDELVEILRRRIDVTLDGDEIIEMQLRRGQIYAEALGDLDASLACYEQVLEQETRNRPALEAEEVIFFRREDWVRLREVYEKLIDVADGDDELAALYARMARIASDALENDDDATELWNRVLDIRGEDPDALAAIAELYGRREMWEDLVEVIERQVGAAEDENDQVVLYKRLGRVWQEKLGRDRSALDAWLCAYEINPHDTHTLRAVAYLYRATQSWEELSQTLRRLLEAGQVTGEIDENEMVELYAEIGELEGDLLGRVDEAVGAWQRVLALTDSRDFRALNSLEQLFTREARWEECIDVLERRAGVLEDPSQQLETLIQAGAIWEEKVLDLGSAAQVYERVRAADPSNRIASRRLEEIYTGQHRWAELNDVLLDRANNLDDTAEKIKTLQAVAKTYEQELGDQDSAYVVLEAAFQLNYADNSTSVELERLATATGKWDELLASYSEVVQTLQVDEPERAANLWVKIGRWYGEHLQHIDYAIHSVQQALQLNANHTGALSALADFQRARQSWHELVETLSRHAQVEPEPERQVELYLALADVYEGQLQDPMQAIAAYQSGLATDPACRDALHSLERLYRRHEMWEQLIDVLGRMADLANDDEEVIRRKLEIGQLWDIYLVDSGQSINSYQEVLELDSHNLTALRALEQLYEKTNQSERYLDILEAQLDASPSDDDQISLYERMASAWEERFGKLDRAAEAYEKIVTLDDQNFGAYRQLSRLYQQEGKWESLVDAYRRHIAATADTAQRIDLYCAMGQVYEAELQDYDRAIESYTDVLVSDPDEARSLDALGRLYEKIEEWERAIDVMTQLSHNTHEPQKKVDLLHRIGRITHSNLDMSEDAEEKFLEALTIDNVHVPTMEELVKLYSGRGDWLKAAQMMVRAEAVTANVLDKVRLLHEAARIYLEKLGQKDQAQEYLAAVMALDPEHVEAAEPLAEIYFETQAWQPLSPLLDMLCRKLPNEGRAPQDLMELYYRTARCADELDQFDKSANFYKAAYDIDSTYLPTLVGRADLLFKMQDWDGAGKIYQTILVQHRDSQNEAQVVRTYFRLGMVRQNLGERKKALNMFEKALEIDPNHADTLHAVIAIQEEQGDWEAVIHAKRGLVVTVDAEQQVSYLSEIGDIYQDKLSNPQKAIAAYQEALDAQPDDHQLLQKVLDLYTATEQWKMAVETIERFVALESSTVIKGSYYQAAGTICRDKLKAIDEAIDYYNLSLDSFFSNPGRIPKSTLPRALKAFADIDKILTTKRDWKNQERAYRQMIKRLKANEDSDPAQNPNYEKLHAVLINLWHALGEIYRSRLKQYKSAIAAFEVAQQLQPEEHSRREILAELYLLAGPDQAEKAVAQHMAMLKHEPFKYDSYKALRKIYMDTRQYDKTWCICNTLHFLKKADQEEQQFFEQYKPRGFVKAKQRMTKEDWNAVRHPDENPYIGAIFAAIWQGAAMVRAQPLKSYGLKRKEKRAIENDPLQFSKIMFYTSQVLNITLPEVYLQPETAGEIAIANAMEKNQLIPSMVVRANLLQGRPEKEIAFAAARWLTVLRPDHYLKLALPTNTELKTAFMSAIAMVKPDFPVPPDMRPLVQQYLPLMQKNIPPQWFEQLGMVVNQFLQNAPQLNLAKWGHSVDMSAHRAGFVISGDLEVAARMVSQEQVVVGGPDVKEKIKELVLFSISEDYFGVRQRLGVTIG